MSSKSGSVPRSDRVAGIAIAATSFLLQSNSVGSSGLFTAEALQQLNF